MEDHLTAFLHLDIVTDYESNQGDLKMGNLMWNAVRQPSLQQQGTPQLDSRVVYGSTVRLQESHKRCGCLTVALS